MKKHLIPLLTSLFTGACVLACTPTPVQNPSPEVVLKADTPLAFALLPMAWDGQQFWQLVQEPDVQGLLSQTPGSDESRNIDLDKALPRHKSLSFGQDHIWALDNRNTLYQISRSGKVINTLKPEFPEVGGAEQVTWLDGDLWVLHRSFISPEGTQERSRFFRIEPTTGNILETLIVDSDDFDDAPHQSLAGKDGYFYVAQTNEFVPTKNLIFRISRKEAKVDTVELGRLFTGVQTLFFENDTLYGIELEELTTDCGFRCRGSLQPLPEFETPQP